MYLGKSHKRIRSGKLTRCRLITDSGSMIGPADPLYVLENRAECRPLK
jgi:hypothetical protein